MTKWTDFVKKRSAATGKSYQAVAKMAKTKKDYAALNGTAKKAPAKKRATKKAPAKKTLASRKKRVYNCPTEKKVTRGKKTATGRKKRVYNCPVGGQDGGLAKYGTMNYDALYGDGGVVIGGVELHPEYYRMGEMLGDMLGGAAKGKKEKGLLTSLLSGLNANVSID